MAHVSDKLDRVAQQRTDLNVFAVIVAILESGAVSADCYSDAQAIIRRANAAQAKCLKRYDTFGAQLLSKSEG